MNQERVWREMAVLPPEARQEAPDFIELLRKRNQQARPKEQRPMTQPAVKAFVGI